MTGARTPEPSGGAAARAVETIAAPLGWALTSALRRVAKVRPDAFERIGEYGVCAFRICPDELPFVFVLRPRAEGGHVRVVARNAPDAAVAAVRGPLRKLLALFDGRGDADAAYFGRELSVEGDISAVVALHNAIEAADLDLLDLLPRLPLRRRRRSWAR